MAGKETAVKKYVMRPNAEERAKLTDVVGAGKRSTQLPTKARIPQKADVSDAGTGWSDSSARGALGLIAVQVGELALTLL